MQNKEIKKFYDDFLDSRMLGYRLYGNKRIDLATKFILKNVKKNDNVLEIGCGIGIVTERVARKLKYGHIWAFDISDRNIWYAKKTVKNRNVDFFVADVLSDFNLLKNKISSPVNVFLLIDVIEHIPKNKHIELFNSLLSIASESASFLLTFPSEFYQRYLKENNPDELQIIDEEISMKDILLICEHNNLFIKYFEMKNVWMYNQYVHCLISTKRPIQKLNYDMHFIHFLSKVINKIKLPYNKRKYIKKIFKSLN